MNRTMYFLACKTLYLMNVSSFDKALKDYDKSTTHTMVGQPLSVNFKILSVKKPCKKTGYEMRS